MDGSVYCRMVRVRLWMAVCTVRMVRVRLWMAVCTVGWLE